MPPKPAGSEPPRGNTCSVHSCATRASSLVQEGPELAPLNASTPPSGRSGGSCKMRSAFSLALRSVCLI
eukprot:2424577-Prymnesium_polylepis.1